MAKIRDRTSRAVEEGTLEEGTEEDLEDAAYPFRIWQDGGPWQRVVLDCTSPLHLNFSAALSLPGAIRLAYLPPHLHMPRPRCWLSTAGFGRACCRISTAGSGLLDCLPVTQRRCQFQGRNLGLFRFRWRSFESPECAAGRVHTCTHRQACGAEEHQLEDQVTHKRTERKRVSCCCVLSGSPLARAVLSQSRCPGSQTWSTHSRMPL